MGRKEWTIATRQGERAYHEGLTLEANPYNADDPLHRVWEAGYKREIGKAEAALVADYE